MSRGRATIVLSSSDGCKTQLAVPLHEDALLLASRYLVDISDSISLLQQLQVLSVRRRDSCGRWLTRLSWSTMH